MQVGMSYADALRGVYGEDPMRGRLLDDESSSVEVDDIAIDVALLCLEDDEPVKILPAHAKERPETLSHSRGVWRVRPISGGRVVSASYDGLAKVYNPTVEKAKPTVLQSGFKSSKRKECLSIAELSDKTIITGYANGSMSLWDGDTCTFKGYIKERKGARFGFYSMAALDDNRLVTGACMQPKDAKYPWKHVVQVWNLENQNNLAKQRPVSVLEGHQGGISAVVALENGQIATASADKTIRVWDLVQSECVGMLKGHTDYIYSLSDLGSHMLVSGSRDKRVVLWDHRSGNKCGELKMPEALQAHASTVHDVASYEEVGILTASRDAYVKLWDSRQTDRVIKILDTEDAFAYSACSVGNSLIAAGTCVQLAKNKQGGRVRLWDLK